MKKLKLVIKIIVTLVLFIGIVVCIYKKTYDDSVDISGTIIAKDKVAVGRGSQRYVFAIHPDNDQRFVDFDIVVPLHNYAKFEVGDKVIFKDISTYQRLRDPKWYNDVEIFVLLIFLLAIILLGWLLFLDRW